jgi:hypothetical protein
LDKLDHLIDQKLKDKLNEDISLNDQPDEPRIDTLDSLDHGEITAWEKKEDTSVKERMENARQRFNALVSSWNGRIKAKKE